MTTSHRQNGNSYLVVGRHFFLGRSWHSSENSVLYLCLVSVLHSFSYTVWHSWQCARLSSVVFIVLESLPSTRLTRTLCDISLAVDVLRDDQHGALQGDDQHGALQGDELVHDWPGKMLILTVGSLCWWCNKPWDGQHKDVETCPEVLTKLLVSEQLQSWTVWSWWWRWVSPLQWQELEWWSTPWSKPFILGLHHHWLTLWLLVMFWLSALTLEIDK